MNPNDEYPTFAAFGLSQGFSHPVDIGDSSKIRLPKLSHIVAERLRTQIVTGKLSSGDCLPPEAELIEIFKVSRPTIREALRILETEGLVVLGRGIRSGAQIQLPSVGRAAHYAAMVLSTAGATMAEIHEARMALEPPLTRSLAESADKSGLVALKECLIQQQGALAKKDYAAALTAINRFHELLCQSAGNSVLTLLVGMLHALSRSTASILVERGGTSSEEVHKNMVKTTSGHRRLIELLESGNGEQAEQFWATYMKRSHEFLTRSGLGAFKLNYDSPASP
ncbi:FadR/GntR family transcriptional regulator [Paraburkholderia phytofirmans]|uniref:FadR/GntR family transcriptional regulator n=1 Tax=Paraburkholderia phytofirmans TaxID=261302 RepID=UPI0038B96D1C